MSADAFELPLRPQTGTQEVIWTWAMREIAPWFHRPRSRAPLYAALEALAAASPTMMAYRIRGGDVTLLAKRRSVEARVHGVDRGRAALYRTMLQEAVDRWVLDLDVVIALSVGDAAHDTDDLPTFAFQKLRGRPILLLPDIDFLILGHYENPNLVDALSYLEKRTHAVFVGGTTGRGIVTAEKVKRLALPRLHAAAHFHGNPNVTFRLPRLVQTESPEVDAMLAALPYCGGETMSWQQQYGSKFMISMDGNGATCSRVALSLKSNSVLLKYDSLYQLYYFGGLAPWTHYVPISRHQDIDAAVALEQAEPGFFAPVAGAGSRFFETYLTRENVLFYTAALLCLYARCYPIQAGTDDAAPLQAAGRRRDAAAARALGIVVHVQSTGDRSGTVNRWAGTVGGGLWLEGFALTAGAGLAPQDIAYRALLADRTWTDWVHPPEFCGTRGLNSPICGVAIRLDGEARKNWLLSYEVSCVDAFRSTVTPAGETCALAPPMPLEALRINLLRRSS